MHELPLLSLLLLVPVAGAALVWVAPHAAWARSIALFAASAAVAAAVAVAAAFDAGEPAFQLVEKRAWIPSLNVHYMVGVDGISVLFLPAAALLFAGVILASWTSVHLLPRLYYSLVLLLEAAILGVFCALDTVLFFLFWELTLAPFYFLVSLWGIGPNRRQAAAKYTLVMLAGGIPLLLGVLVLAFSHATAAGATLPEGLAFDLPTLLTTPLSRGTQHAVFLLLLLGFGVKVPIFPLHTWLPALAIEGPAAITALLVGMKLGAYGLIRFAVPVAPAAAQEMHWLLAGLGTVSILYGALVALAQTNLRSMLAYASLSHVGMVVLGLASLNLQGLQGAVLQLLNFTVSAGGLFLLASFLHQRTGSTDVLSLGGAARSLPQLASAFLLCGLAGMGLPGTSGFPAEFLILLSALKTHSGAGVAALVGMVLGAAYFLGLYRRAFFGPAVHAPVVEAEDLGRRELIVAIVCGLVILAVGFYPSLVLDVIAPAAEMWVARLPVPGR
jgi:NADH-quinone oxidoreductase subunit M